MIGLELLPGAFGKYVSQLLMVKGGPASALLRIDENKLLCATFQIVAIPETRVVVKPMRINTGLVDAALRPAESAAPLLGGRVGLVCGRGLFLGKAGTEHCEQGQ